VVVAAARVEEDREVTRRSRRRQRDKRKDSRTSQLHRFGAEFGFAAWARALLSADIQRRSSTHMAGLDDLSFAEFRRREVALSQVWCVLL
jgi:hypothetical protein